MNDIFDCKLLLVDDEPELRRMVGSMLRQSGFKKDHFCGRLQPRSSAVYF